MLHSNGDYYVFVYKNLIASTIQLVTGEKKETEIFNIECAISGC